MSDLDRNLWWTLLDRARNAGARSWAERLPVMGPRRASSAWWAVLAVLAFAAAWWWAR